jgi:hypothetical protein
MVISSRTPEGLPHRCSVCRQDCSIEPSIYPRQDATCPNCGSLLVLDEDEIQPWSLEDMLMRRQIEPEEGVVHLSLNEITDSAEIALLERGFEMIDAK